jgi:hypothetical protein
MTKLKMKLRLKFGKKVTIAVRLIYNDLLNRRGWRGYYIHNIIYIFTRTIPEYMQRSFGKRFDHHLRKWRTANHVGHFAVLHHPGGDHETY